MPVFKVNVKWGKEVFKNVELNTDEPPSVFKAQLFGLSGVAPDRQKLMSRGLIEDNWDGKKIKNGMQLMMLGSAGEIPEILQKKAGSGKDVESMDVDADESGVALPHGIENMGNTCYFNSSVQLINSCPEIRAALSRFPTSSLLAPVPPEKKRLVESLKTFFPRLSGKNSNDPPPVALLATLHQAFPQYAERDRKGNLQQHDANECLSGLMGVMQDQLPPILPKEVSDIGLNFVQPETNGSATISDGENGQQANLKFKNAIAQYFGFEYQQTVECTEDPDDSLTNQEFVSQLICHIDQNTKYLYSSFRKFTGQDGDTLTKRSEKLDRDAVYSIKRKFSRLPAYASIQLSRFYYKTIQKREGSEGVNAKVLKDVKFQTKLDLYDFCTEELQKQLAPMREKFRKYEENEVEQKVKQAKNVEKSKRVKYALTRTGLPIGAKAEPFWFPEDIGSNNSGYYDLQGVITHQGRSSNSGHYVAWIKLKPGEWLKFDDNEVSVVVEDEVLKLSGGGDWHTAYVLLYGPRILPVVEESDKPDSAPLDEIMSEAVDPQLD